MPSSSAATVGATVGPAETPGPIGTYAPQPQPSIALAAAGAPALPRKVAFVEGKRCVLADGAVPCSSWGVTWEEPNAMAAVVRVYAVVSCPRQPTTTTLVPCLKTGDVIAEGSLVLLAEAPAGQGSLSVTLQTAQSQGLGILPLNGPHVYAVLVQAVNAQGGSLFAFAAVASTCRCTG